MFVLDHFWSHVLQGPAESIPYLILFLLHAPTKVANFDDVTILDQYVFRLDVSMNETLLMKVIDARADLYEEIEGSIFT